MGIVKVSKTVNDTVEGTLRKVASAIRELGHELESIDSKAGSIVYWKYKASMKQYKYQCVAFDMGDGSTMCTIRTIDYGEAFKGPLTQWSDSINLFHNSRKESQKILDLL